MPLWHIYCPKGAYTDQHKGELAERIADAYVELGMPRFYVSVIFEDVDPGSFYIGGKPADDFVRIWVDHIARGLKPEHRGWWMKRVKEIVTPFIEVKSFRWEAHVDETETELWTIQGLKPPPEGSEAEKRWFAENRPSKYQ
jgi:phenylpyruvate tautomerase PptA (4-oxalocrotonate tautomerase family)